MAKKVIEKIRVNTTRYLDEAGLEILWKKIKKYVKENAINIDGSDINLSEYATIEYVEEALANIDTSDIDLIGYATKEDLTNELIAYAKKEDIPSIEGLATKAYVNHAVSTVDSNPGVYIGTDEPADPEYSVWIDTDDGEAAELSNYYTKAEVDALIPNNSNSTNVDQGSGKLRSGWVNSQRKIILILYHQYNDKPDFICYIVKTRKKWNAFPQKGV